MRSDEQSNPDDSQMPRRRFELFYFERVGSRSYLRFTRLTVILIIGLTVVSLGSILVLFLISAKPGDSSPVNVNIAVPSQSPFSPDKPIIRQPPPAPLPPKVANQPKYSIPARSTPTINHNVNEQSVPKRMPQARPSEAPP